MSRKKIVRKASKTMKITENKNKTPQLALIEPPATQEPDIPIPEPPEPEPTKEQQMAKMIYKDLIQDGLKIDGIYENDYMVITPLMAGDNPDKVDCYEIVSKSNKDVVVYVSFDEIVVSYKNNALALDESALIYLAANMVNYIKRNYIVKAA